ncbi:MAG: hypothetical protein GY749_13730 [Desulfobacteraceae bacterium]|nr:hypothetical protein [Desulfobacteraceae bacterium]
MPNGGSDCCGTCWFNKKNKGKAGYNHAKEPGEAFCIIREIIIADPFYTYCGNHPHRRPERDNIPLGPIFTGDSSGSRKIWLHSPDTEEIREHLLKLIHDIKSRPKSEYPIGIHTYELVVWQLGEFKESRAIKELQRITNFRTKLKIFNKFGHTHERLKQLASEALDKIQKKSA